MTLSTVTVFSLEELRGLIKGLPEDSAGCVSIQRKSVLDIIDYIISETKKESNHGS